ncbi:MAG: hypothetical protein EGR97_00285 [Clostridiales bacterium]|jgi:ribosomal protein S15P/S13E|nr:hypothetical protein [Clostridiales bacterium]
MSERDLKNMRSLDEAAEKAGGFVSFLNEKDIRYDIRKINKYCKDKGIEPVDLTIRELNSFIIKSPN